MQPRVNRRHHRHVDIACAGGVHLSGGPLLRLRRAGIAVEEQRALCEARQRRHRRLMRLVGSDDREDGVGAGDSLGRARRPDDVRSGVIGALGGAHIRVGGIGLDVVARRPAR